MASLLTIKRRELAPLVEFVLWDAERRKALGQPSHVMIGDGNHLFVEPRILRTEIARSMVGQPERFGRTVVVVENADAKSSEQLQEHYAGLQAGDAAAQLNARKMEERVVAAAKTLSPAQVAELADALEWTKLATDGASLVFPDRRTGLNLEGKSRDEVYADLLSPTRFQASHRCKEIVAAEVAAKLSPQELAALEAKENRISTKMFGGVDGLASLPASDAGTADRVARDGKMAEGNATVILLYGAAHLAKGKDLDEHLKGTHITVEPDEGGALAMRMLYLEQPHLFNDFPQVAWRHFAKDPDESLMIMDEAILKAWHQRQHGTVLSDDEAKVRVRATKAAYLGFADPTPDLARLDLWEIAAGKREGTKEQQVRARLEFGVLRPTDTQPQMTGTEPGFTGETMSDYRKRMAVPACYAEAREIVEAIKQSIAPSLRDEDSDVNAPTSPKDPIGKGERRREI